MGYLTMVNIHLINSSLEVMALM